MGSSTYAELQALAAELREKADRIAALPQAFEEELRERAGDVPIEIIHGSEAQWAAWARYAERWPPRDPLNLYPNLEIVRSLIVPQAGEAVAPHRGRARFRAVIGADAVITMEDHDVIRHLVAAGVEVRLSANVTSWAYTDPGVLAAIPLVWGEHPPTSIMVIRDAAISSALGALLEPIWASARPVAVPAAEWPDTLRLLALGLSDTAVATAQSSSLRTVQRRINEAMTYYGVNSRFELGAAWSADQRSGDRDSA